MQHQAFGWLANPRGIAPKSSDKKSIAADYSARRSNGRLKSMTFVNQFTDARGAIDHGRRASWSPK